MKSDALPRIRQGLGLYIDVPKGLNPDSEREGEKIKTSCLRSRDSIPRDLNASPSPSPELFGSKYNPQRFRHVKRENIEWGQKKAFDSRFSVNTANRV